MRHRQKQVAELWPHASLLAYSNRVRHGWASDIIITGHATRCRLRQQRGRLIDICGMGMGVFFRPNGPEHEAHRCLGERR
jgi:hypothetical protein